MPRNGKTFAFGRKKRHRAKPRDITSVKPVEIQQIDETSVLEFDDSERIHSQSSPQTNHVEMDDEETGAPADHDTSRAEEKFSYFQPEGDEFDAATDANRCHLLHSSFLSSLLGAIMCKVCFGSNLALIATTKMGLAFHYRLYCADCNEDIFRGCSSPTVRTRRDINYRVVLAAKECGISNQKLTDLFSIMNLFGSMHHKTFTDIASEIHDASVLAAEDSMEKAAKVITARCPQSEKSGKYPVVPVSFDGNWQKRGHSSHNGVGIAVHLDTGLVIDTEVITNYCRHRETGSKRDAPSYGEWEKQHKGKCNKNVDGSSNATEVEAAVRIFPRAAEKRKLVYGTMLCDGDSKAFDAVRKLNLHPIHKEDCINHIAKRMFNALDNLKKTNKAQLNRQLTRRNIEKITNTYATNLRRNAPDTHQMKLDVLGGIFNMSSTDAEPKHRLCPKGEASWCKYNRALAKGEKPPPHTPTIKPAVLPVIYPVIKRLVEPELLARCARMATQNNNESFNAQIWNRCSKSGFASRKSVETAVALATLSFNCGPLGLKFVMDKLEVPWEITNKAHALKKEERRIQLARNKAKGVT